MARGRPKKFKDGQKLCELFDKFCLDIIENEYNRIPSQTEFCRWLKANYEATDRKTVYNALNEYFPTIKKDFERMQSDLIAQGGMLGKYQNSMSIFVLKNWCRWKDNPDIEFDNSSVEKTLVQIRECANADRDKS